MMSQRFLLQLFLALGLVCLNGTPLLAAAGIDEEAEKVMEEYTRNLAYSEVKKLKGLRGKTRRFLKEDGE
jgi:hypothetical protein